MEKTYLSVESSLLVIILVGFFFHRAGIHKLEENSK